MSDAHVRPARAEDATDFGAIQAASYAVAYGNLLPPEALGAITPDAAAEAWQQAIETPPSPAHRVFTAYERATTGESVVGFAAVSPADPGDEDVDDTTAELVTILIEPRWGRRGHGSRLLSAAVTTAQSIGARTMIAWILDGDIASDKFLESAGWARDGWSRTLDAAGTPIRQHRLHTSLEAAADQQASD